MSTNKFSSKTNHAFEVSVENYLKTIWNLSQIRGSSASGEDAAVTNSEIASALKVQRPSVTGMTQKLERLGLIRFRGRQILLSTKGRERVLELIRRHRLIEIFLNRTLDLDGLELHEEAERLEHAISPALLQRISSFLKHPDVGLDGLTIPEFGSKDHREKTRIRNATKLSEISVGSRAKILSLPDYSEALNAKLLQKQAKIGQEVVLKRLRPDNVLEIRLLDARSSVLLDQSEAELIDVLLVD